MTRALFLEGTSWTQLNFQQKFPTLEVTVILGAVSRLLIDPFATQQNPIESWLNFLLLLLPLLWGQRTFHPFLFRLWGLDLLSWPPSLALGRWERARASVFRLLELKRRSPFTERHLPLHCTGSPANSATISQHKLATFESYKLSLSFIGFSTL